MTEWQHTVTNPELYESLINRLGLALETAKTAFRLRDESPAVVELRGLSRAEFELIEAYLEKDVMAAGDIAKERPRETMVSPALPQRSAKVFWLADQRRAQAAAKAKRYSSGSNLKR
ncbi:hypothetical protein ACCD10_20655 [Pseudomonas sp. Pseusp122]|uniref:hypothetical protein n=1 Tax=unclassified Pseudomonas TaxID=196821 RepID=UPI0039A65412